MVTRNFIKSINSVFAGTATPRYSGIDFNNTSGTINSIINAYDKNLLSPNGNTMQATLSIGSGTTPPSIDDYKLENMIDIRPKMISKVSDATGYTIIAATFTNETEESLTVSEVGLSQGIYGGKNFLLAREVFDTINLAPGETITVTMRLF